MVSDLLILIAVYRILCQSRDNNYFQAANLFSTKTKFIKGTKLKTLDVTHFSTKYSECFMRAYNYTLCLVRESLPECLHF